MSDRRPNCSLPTDQPLSFTETGSTIICTGCGHEQHSGASTLPEVMRPRSVQVAASIRNWKAGDPLPLLQAAQGAQAEFRNLRHTRRMKTGAWAGLAALALVPIMLAAMCPELIVSAIPASISAYQWAGRDVNIYGIEIRNIDLQHLIIDGRKVIALKGELANTSATARKIPWLRFGLLSKDNAEVYHWTLDTEVRPLKPGESTSFVTRLASPPEAARNLQIRFARADEIGSNQAHE